MLPKVAAVMLTTGSRPAMLRRAIESFHAQAYPNKVLILLNSGSEAFVSPSAGVQIAWSPGKQRSIGELRNIANALAVVENAEVIAHFDDDDWSAPGRLSDQVAYLQASGAEAVGFSEMLFWRTDRDPFPGKIHPKCEGGPAGLAYINGEYLPCPKCGGSQICEGVYCHPDDRKGEAWRYCSPNPKCLLGTSLVYWAKTWQRVPFPRNNEAEDHLWLLKIKNKAGASAGIKNPLMIASVHGENTCSKIEPGKREWTRAAYADEFCRKAMRL